MVWVGGMLFLALVVVPATRLMPQSDRAGLFEVVGRRFRSVGWTCIGILIVTGTINAAYRGVTLDNVFTTALWTSSFGTALGLKLIVVAAMLVVEVVHDFVVGPAATRALARRDPEAVKETARLRKRAATLARMSALLALIVVALAIMIVRGIPSLY
ncbi:MAG: CopD family protein [Chloroflexi bacterium]|nr:CopD family protein [Chloroflexota bacterium]